MRIAILAAFALVALPLFAQDGSGNHTTVRPVEIWAGLDTESPDPSLSAATLSGSQQRAVRQAIHAHAKLDGIEDCDTDEPNGEWLEKIIFETIPVTQQKQVILAQAGVGCARGGQGANGAMWIVALDGPEPVLLAAPENGFHGWLYSVRPSGSHGYHDVVLGWHYSGFETGLKYFRFDGKSYRCIGSAERNFDRNNGQMSFLTDASCGKDD
jgi:hypothetical protein